MSHWLISHFVQLKMWHTPDRYIYGACRCLTALLIIRDVHEKYYHQIMTSSFPVTTLEQFTSSYELGGIM